MGAGSFHPRLLLFSVLAALLFMSPVSRSVHAAAAAGAPGTAEFSPEQLEKVTSEVYRLLEILSRSPTGQTLVKSALKVWNLNHPKELRRRITLGLVSRTDAVLTRHYNPTTGQEMRERNVTITIKAAQPLGDRVLDLAHEITHAVAEPAWDPYDPELTPGKYILASLEAKGGEIEAVSLECAVAQELQDSGVKLGNRCDRYFTRTGTDQAVNRELVRRDFYRVGKWRDEVLKKLGSEGTLFPHLSQKSPELYSATGGAPYPVSLIREYEELNRIACENAKRRERSHGGRSPASAALLMGRCQSVDAANEVTEPNLTQSATAVSGKSQ